MNLRRVLLISTALSSVIVFGGRTAYAQQFDWSGFYVGAGIGSVFGSGTGELSWMDPEDAIWDSNLFQVGQNTVFDDSPVPKLHNGTLENFPGAPTGVGLEATVGFNTQMDNFLFGVEASILTGPFVKESEFRQSGTLSYTLSSIESIYTSTTTPTLGISISTSYDYSTSTTYYSTTSALYSAVTTDQVYHTTNITNISTSPTSTLHTFTSTVTITNSVTTTTSTQFNTFTTFQTTVTPSPTETIEFPVTTTVLDTFDTTYYSSVTTSTTSTEYLTTDVSYSELTTTTDSITNTYTGTYSNTVTTTGSTVVTYLESTELVSYPTTGIWTETITGRAQIDWMATIKGRIGLTMDRTLLFATGGLAIGQVSQETTGLLHVQGQTTVDPAWSGTDTEMKFGFVVGAGIEQALDDHWIVSGSAEYFNLGTVSYDVLGSNSDGTGTQITGKATQVLDGGSVKFGIKYKF